MTQQHKGTASRAVRLICLGCSQPIDIEDIDMLTQSLVCGDCGTPININCYPDVLTRLNERKREKKDAKHRAAQLIRGKRLAEKEEAAAQRARTKQERIRQEAERREQIRQEQERIRQEQEQRRQQQVEEPTEGTEHGQPRPQVKRKARKRYLVLVVVVLAPFVIYSWARNHDLQERLASCPSSDGLDVDVYYGGYLSSDEVVFDYKGVEQHSSARLIDNAHLLLEFAGKLDRDVRQLTLANNGTKLWYLNSSDFRELAEQYRLDARIWAFSHLPERLRHMNGLRAYDAWTGGWLGVMKEQTEDLSDMLETWVK